VSEKVKWTTLNSGFYVTENRVVQGTEGNTCEQPASGSNLQWLPEQPSSRLRHLCEIWKHVWLVFRRCAVLLSKPYWSFQFRRFRKTAKSGVYLRYVFPSVRMEQLGSHWRDFYEIWYLSIFRKPVEKIHVLLKCDKNNGYFTWKPMYMITSH